MELSINTKLEIQHLKVSIYHLKQKHFLVFFGIFWIYSPLKPRQLLLTFRIVNWEKLNVTVFVLLWVSYV